MRRLILSIFLFFFFACGNTVAEIFLSEDLSKSLSNLYSFHPQIKYEREILKSKDELLPRAFSEFRPEIKGYVTMIEVISIIEARNDIIII